MSGAVDAVNWLDESGFVWLRSGDKGETQIWYGSVGASKHGPLGVGKDMYLIDSIDAPAGNLKLAALGGDEYAVVVSAQADFNGQLFNPEKVEKTHSTHQLTWAGKAKNALWYGKLSRSKSGSRYELSLLKSALKGTGLEFPLEPFGRTDNFDVSSRRIAFVAKDPDLNPALNTKCYIYLPNVDSWTQNSKTKPMRVAIKGFEGLSTSPVFSPDARRVAFLSMKHAGLLRAEHNCGLVAAQAGWDKSPSAIAWTVDGKGLLVTAEDDGRARLFLFQDGGQAPLPLTKEGSVGDVLPLNVSGKIFYTGSSLIDNSFFAIIEVQKEQQHLDAWATPQLVIHRSKDYGICIAEGLAAFKVLQARGIESQLLTFPDENHWVLKPENGLVWHKAVLSWIRKYVGMTPCADERLDGSEDFGGVRDRGEVEGMEAQGRPET